MWVFWRKNKLIDNFAIKLADELYSQIPPTIFDNISNTGAKKVDRRWENEVQLLIVRLRDFKISYKLGIYGKARLHLTFMDRLRSHGYAEDVVKELNDFLLIKTP